MKQSSSSLKPTILSICYIQVEEAAVNQLKRSNGRSGIHLTATNSHYREYCFFFLPYNQK